MCLASWPKLCSAFRAWARVPGKATYQRFETEPGAEFEFYLAQKLGMTVGRLRSEISQAEFADWSDRLRKDPWKAMFSTEQEIPAGLFGG